METALTPLTTVVKVPLEQILVVVEDNPRGSFPKQEVDEMASSLRLGGQEEPILLRPRTDEEKSQAHPDKPYKLVGGYLRVAAAPLAGLTALDAIIRDMTPRQARKAAILDNVRKDMRWLAWAESAESLLADDPDMTIQDAADLIAKDRAKVSKAQKLLKVLNKPAREAIRVNYTTPGGYDLPEACALCLGDLATGGEGDEELIERAVKVALERRLTLEKTKKLADWVKKGGQPEDFGAKEPKDTPEDPLAAYWPQLGPGFKVKFKGGGGYEVHMAIQDGHQAWNAAMAAKWALQGQGGTPPAPAPTSSQVPQAPSTHAQVGAAIVGNILGKQIKQAPGHIANRVIPGFTPAFHLLTSLIQKLGVKNLKWATVLVTILVLLVGSYFISQGTRFIGRALSHMDYSRSNTASNTYTPPPASNTAPNVGLPVSIQNSQGVGHASIKPNKKTKPLVVPPWAREERIFAAEFGSRFYGVNAQNWDDTQNYFIDHLNPSYLAPFLHQYFGADFTNQVRHHNLAYSLDGAQSQFLRMKGGSGIFLFKGLQTKEGDRQSPVSLPVALVIQIQHHPDGNSLVEKVTVVNPGEEGDQAEKTDGSAKGDLSPGAGAVAGGSAKGEDPLKAVSDRVKDYQSAVNTADNAKSATDKAKDILGVH